MKCPNDQTVLALSYREEIEIDYCPQCRGVWLDRGELDKIIERSQTATRPSAPESTVHETPSRPRTAHRDYDDDDDDYSPHSPHHKKKKREGFLGDLFDF